MIPIEKHQAALCVTTRKIRFLIGIILSDIPLAQDLLVHPLLVRERFQMWALQGALVTR